MFLVVRGVREVFLKVVKVVRVVRIVRTESFASGGIWAPARDAPTVNAGCAVCFGHP